MLKLWELAPSPNSVKVRLALKVKRIGFEAIPVDPRDRRALIELSGQELTPVIEDRGIVLNDSEAILHYLDANYRDRPRLWPSDRDGRTRSDAWKRELDSMVVPGWLPLFRHAVGFTPELDDSARDTFAEALGGLERRLEAGADDRAERPLVDDLRVATWALYACPGEGLVGRVPLFARIRDVFGIDADDYPRLQHFLDPWQRRMAEP